MVINEVYIYNSMIDFDFYQERCIKLHRETLKFMDG